MKRPVKTVPRTLVTGHYRDQRGAGSIFLLTATLGVILAAISGGVFALNLHFSRQTHSAERRVGDEGLMVSSFLQASLALSEQRPLPAGVITEDESAKINLHSMTYALPYVLNLAGGLTFQKSALLITALAEAQGMWIASTRVSQAPLPTYAVAYPWRPPAAYTLSVEPNDPAPPYDQPENRHMMWGRFGSLPPWHPLEAPEDLYGLAADDGAVTQALNLILPSLTTAPTLGLNLNTCSNKSLLRAVLTWQRDAHLGHPRYAQAYDQMIYNQPPISPEISTWTVKPRAYSKITRRLYPPSLGLPQTTVNLMASQFRGVRTPTTIPPSSVDAILAGRPYQQNEILQLLAVHSFLFPLGDEWVHRGGPSTEAVHFKLKGPGPYAAASNGYYTIRLFNGAVSMNALVKIRPARPVKIVRWMVQ